MATRHVKCTCTHCARLFTTCATNIREATARGGLICPICAGPAVEGDVVVSTEVSETHAELCARIAEEIAAPLNRIELRRRAAIQAGRAHRVPKRGDVRTAP